MNMAIDNRTDSWYRTAERKAESYLSSLQTQLNEQSHVTALTDDFAGWSKTHIHKFSLLSFLSRSKSKPDTRSYRKYIRWMTESGQLDAYLERSVTYMYMRDLGKAMNTPDTQAKIERVAADLKSMLIDPVQSEDREELDSLSLAGIYRWAQKEGVESAAIWAISKIKIVSSRIPDEMNAEHAVRKLIKIMIGVVMHVMDEMDDRVAPEERVRRLDQAIRLGYCYGLTYPFIDDLLDSGVLNEREKEQYSRMIRTTLIYGSVPELGQWADKNKELLHYVHSELKEAFEYIKNHQSPASLQTFFEQSYVFFESQHIDRQKSLANAKYTNEELYLPVILKSSSSRLIVRSVISAPEDEGFDHRTFYYGIYNQLADDFADMHDDLQEGAVTPYTYYWQHRDQRPDLINPFELYWAVIAHLIHDVYGSDAKTRDVILDRAINGLKRFKERAGNERYAAIMKKFALANASFHQLIQQMVHKAHNVEFFDKLLRDQMIAALKRERQEKAQFRDTVKTVREQINDHLQLVKQPGIPEMKESLIDAANYSLTGDGKRLRPILAWVMGVREYGLDESAIMPLMRSLEYMHTASLIFDDLPSQDNASSRRGRPTLHQIHNSAIAELTGLFLIQKAIEEQSALDGFDPKAVLALIHYSSQKAADISAGQAMDLHAKGKAQSLEQLNTICFYKTGIAFEASLVMPAILAQVKESEITVLKQYAYHAGIAFQIKDDLLDAEGNQQLLGKPVGQDAQNNTSTFVTILGLEGARKQMWEHYCLAMAALNELPRNISFLKHLLTYMINRDK
ncbi:polyprenyl synthetase family protein [Paenibacillus sp. NEAU-GSW1]|uniref:polyprenyl synthetase family protein n=1 Tax=Paenibacillus sp. NEAU-GSW1 TaxID=2682486 RepID=UPI0012E298F9|nr:polyprenyl synthetase family protein [Paenibacillus sp. NEAU-GSW1]MUT68847.1 polyprenyl synthetase family protein [Paenibacillus sp. NEAU-GSW1]